jgi:hypothetical protein
MSVCVCAVLCIGRGLEALRRADVPIKAEEQLFNEELKLAFANILPRQAKTILFNFILFQIVTV